MFLSSRLKYALNSSTPTTSFFRTMPRWLVLLRIILTFSSTLEIHLLYYLIAEIVLDILVYFQQLPCL